MMLGVQQLDGITTWTANDERSGTPQLDRGLALHGEGVGWPQLLGGNTWRQHLKGLCTLYSASHANNKLCKSHPHGIRFEILSADQRVKDQDVWHLIHRNNQGSVACQSITTAASIENYQTCLMMVDASNGSYWSLVVHTSSVVYQQVDNGQ